MEDQLLFTITIVNYKVPYRFQVERVYADDIAEKYIVRAKSESFLLECARPMFAANGTLHLPWNWKQVEGRSLKHWFKEICDKIQNEVMLRIV